MKNPYQVIKDFEESVAEYTGAPHVVAVSSCTNALFLCLMWAKVAKIITGGKFVIPKRTYLSVPQQIKLVGFEFVFKDIEWKGMYPLSPLNIYDCARRFTSNMFKDLYNSNTLDNHYFMCTSHHWAKILGIERGGCILHNDPESDKWFRKVRHHGRSEGVHPRDDQPIIGYDMLMLPSVAANGLVRLSHLPKHNPDLPNDDYPDLSQMEIFK